MAEAGVRLTVKVRLRLSELPSETDAFPIASTRRAVVIDDRACGLAVAEAPRSPERTASRVNVSSLSAATSPSTPTLNVWIVAPGAKVSVPDAVVKSALFAVPAAVA